MHLFRKRQPHEPEPLVHIDLAGEMAALSRQYDGLVQARRMEWLASRLGSGMAIRRSDCGFCGDRLGLLLDDGSILVLRLLWPERRPLVRLNAIRWNEPTGWDVRLTTSLGESITCSAWRASLTLASEVPAEPERPVARPHRKTRS